MAFRQRIRPLGALLSAALLGAACANVDLPNPGIPNVPAATPAVRAQHGGWVQALQFSGDVQGKLENVVPADAPNHSECTGRNSRRAEAWASTLYGPVGGTLYGLVTTVAAYRGPGLYRGPVVKVQVLRQDAATVWRSEPGDPVTFVVAVDEESGTLDATLTDLSTATTKVHVTGRWACQT
jgi:hypothetical protein